VTIVQGYTHSMFALNFVSKSKKANTQIKLIKCPFLLSIDPKYDYQDPVS